MNGQEFVLLLVAMVFIFSIIRHRMGIPVRSMREMRGDPPAETHVPSHSEGELAAEAPVPSRPEGELAAEARVPSRPEGDPPV